MIITSPPRLGLLITSFVLVILFSNVSKTSSRQAEDIPLPPQRGLSKVVITNELASKEDLIVHCKSKDDDLGEHRLRYTGSYSFSFERHIWFSTLFFCGFRWGNQFHWFDIYTPDSPDCTTPYPCEWFVDAQGPCRFERDIKKQYCYSWNK